jgi:hypothetical protein
MAGEQHLAVFSEIDLAATSFSFSATRSLGSTSRANVRDSNGARIRFKTSQLQRRPPTTLESDRSFMFTVLDADLIAFFQALDNRFCASARTALQLDGDF